MNPSVSPRRRTAQEGFVLLAILVFILLLSMVTLSLMYRSKAEETAAAAGLGSEQAWSAAMSGVREALRVAAAAPVGSTEWQDNPVLFRDRLVYEDGVDRWFFTVYAPGGSDDVVEVRHGLIDEAAAVNLNHPGGADLAKVPRMTPELLRSLRLSLGQAVPDSSSTSVDPINASDTPGSIGDLGSEPDIRIRTAAIESALSGDFSPPKSTGVQRPGPLASLDALAGLPGFSWGLLHGEDANLNGRLDANEDDGDETWPPDNQDGRLDHGLAQYLTVASYDSDRTSAGRRRTDINDPNDALPAVEFPAAFTNYVAALRRVHLRLGHPADALEATIHVKDEQGQEAGIASGITKEELPRLLDLFTADGSGRHDGLINLNTAGAVVLATLPGIDLALGESIVSARSGLTPERRTTIAWLYQEGLVNAGQFKSLAPHLTARSSQFHFQVVGYSVPSGRFQVLAVSIDVGGTEPRITGIRDLTRLGFPFRPGGGDEKKSDTAASLSRPVGSSHRHSPNG